MNSFIDHIYEFESRYLSAFAKKSIETEGRAKKIEVCPLRTEFQRDRDRIIHCKSFRRLKHKTQVFLSPEGDHYRTRLTHTLEVAQIARTISRALRLNEDLTEAIALGHDLGHTPFGHAGERALQFFTHFEHNEHSLRVVDSLEYDFKGMNLTVEVRDGILNHTSKGKPKTLEGEVVSLSDRIAYINHDIDDAVRAGVLSEEDIPQVFRDAFGNKHGLRINAMIADIVTNSVGKKHIQFSEKNGRLAAELRAYMFESVYTSKKAKGEEGKAIDMIKFLYEHFIKDLSRLPKEYLCHQASDEQRVCDYIAAMTDRYAVKVFEDIMVPRSWMIV